MAGVLLAVEGPCGSFFRRLVEGAVEHAFSQRPSYYNELGTGFLAKSIELRREGKPESNPLPKLPGFARVHLLLMHRHEMVQRHVRQDLANNEVVVCEDYLLRVVVDGVRCGLSVRQVVGYHQALYGEQRPLVPDLTLVFTATPGKLERVTTDRNEIAAYEELHRQEEYRALAGKIITIDGDQNIPNTMGQIGAAIDLWRTPELGL